MGWTTRYGRWQDDLAPPKPRPIRFKHIITGLLLLVLFGGSLACFPLTIVLIPKPELTEYMPSRMHCATCEEIWQQNRDLFNRGDMFCYGPPVYDRLTTKEEEVMFKGEKRCWVIKQGHDKWMRPNQVTAVETKNWDTEAQKFTIRGGAWP